MNVKFSNNNDLPPEPKGKADEKWEDLAAELTEAVLPVALNETAGADSLEKELNLWHAMTDAVSHWDGRARS